MTSSRHDGRVLGWMQLALRLGEDALDHREVPVGCVMVLPKEKVETQSGGKEGKGPDGDIVLAKGRNETNETANATRHEIVAIDEIYAKAESKLRETGYPSMEALLRETELYVTCEPCIMCASAISLAGIGKVFFGCRNEKFGGMGSVIDADGEIPYEEGILEDEAVALFGRFFKRSNPMSKSTLAANEGVDKAPME